MARPTERNNGRLLVEWIALIAFAVGGILAGMSIANGASGGGEWFGVITCGICFVLTLVIVIRGYMGRDNY